MQTSEILNLERKYWQAMKDGDIEGAVALTSFPCVITGPQGHRRVSEADYRGLMAKSDGSRFADVKVEGAEVEFVSADLAFITYNTTINGMKMLDVSTWIREDGAWKCKFHAENPERKETN